MADDPVARNDLKRDLAERFGEPVPVPDQDEIPATWTNLARRGSCRRFTDTPVAPDLIDTLVALALTAPSKSDLQQRDFLVVDDPALRSALDALLATGSGGQAWISGAPCFAVVLGNNRRQRQVHVWRDRPFANDHLDAFFNAAVDAGIALATFVMATEARGLGVTPVSTIRNHAAAVSELLGLPDHVFPVAGLGFGWPAFPPRISYRLPLSATRHRNRYIDTPTEAVAAYDARRAAAQPFSSQRDPARFGTAAIYTWSDDKTRQYAAPERADWGTFVRAKGFKLG